MPAAATKNPDCIHLSAPLELAAGVGQALPAQFSGTAYSGGKVPSYGVVIDVATTKISKRMPLLMEHSRSSIIGVVESAEASGAQITVAGKLFSDMPGGDAERVAELSRRGAPYQMSVGLFGYDEEYVMAGQSVMVNGQKQDGPVVVLRNGKVRECSIVTLGADPNTDAQFFSMPEPGATKPKSETNMTEAEIKALQDQVAAANAQVKQLTEAAAAAETAAKAVAASQRTADVTALFAEIGEKPTAEQSAAFSAMGGIEFSAMAGVMRSTVAKARRANPALFTDTATGEAKAEDKDASKRVINLSSIDIYASRRLAAGKALLV